MKIGILTFHRAENYGALLQAYALKTYLSSLGHDVSFVDYWPEYHICHYKIFNPLRFKELNYKGKFMYIMRWLLSRTIRESRKKKLSEFMYKSLDLSETIEYTDDNQYCDKYDIVFYGSDQIWRKQNLPGCDGFNSWYFGDSHIIAKKVAYAASMGSTDINENEKVEVKSYLKNFDSLSVRESDLKMLVNGLGYDAVQVCDPVFLLSKKDWSKLAVHPKYKSGYILYYNLLNSNESDEVAEMLSKTHGLPVKELNMTKNKRDERYIPDASIEEFLGLILHADYVVSNSFHGLALSIIMEKQVYISGLNAKASRIVSLLNALDISNRLVSPQTLKETDAAIDYQMVNPNLVSFIESSKEFINHSISSVIK